MQGQQTVADAVLLLAPYYFASVPDQGIENFILAVLQKTKLPSYLYNYSVHTGNLISTESYKKVAKQLPHLRGIKCTVTTMSDATSYKEALPHLQVGLSGMCNSAQELLLLILSMALYAHYMIPSCIELVVFLEAAFIICVWHVVQVTCTPCLIDCFARKCWVK